MDPNKPHVPPPYQERSYEGGQSMWARKSAEEAPEVSNYNYDAVGNVVGLESMTTDFGLLGQDQASTSLYGHVGKERTLKYDPAVLLNDAWFCVMTDDGGKLYGILNTLKGMGIQSPADYPFETMFGKSTLWERVNDNDYKIQKRGDAIQLLSKFRAAPPPVDIYDRRALFQHTRG
jgi:hypothetical protein